MNSIIMHFIRKLWGIWLFLFVFALDLFLASVIVEHHAGISYLRALFIVCISEFGVVLVGVFGVGAFLDLRTFVVEKWHESVNECRNNRPRE